jgi:hypothetical protein
VRWLGPILTTSDRQVGTFPFARSLFVSFPAALRFAPALGLGPAVWFASALSEPLIEVRRCARRRSGGGVVRFRGGRGRPTALIASAASLALRPRLAPSLAGIRLGLGRCG